MSNLVTEMFVVVDKYNNILTKHDTYKKAMNHSSTRPGMAVMSHAFWQNEYGPRERTSSESDNSIQEQAIETAKSFLIPYLEGQAETIEQIAESSGIDADKFADSILESMIEIPPSDAVFRKIALGKALKAGSDTIACIDPRTGEIVYRKIADLGVPAAQEQRDLLANKPKIKYSKPNPHQDIEM